MNSCLKILFLVQVVLTITWIYFIPPLTKFGIKFAIYNKLFGQPENIDLNRNVTVELSLGKVIGTTIKPNLVDYYGKSKRWRDVKPVHQFLGIPFAAPPTGNLRFKKPKPVQKWSPNVIEAVNWPASCLQSDQLFGFVSFGDKMSEDCLYLNIWTPSLPSSESTRLKPVFVWIYGGGFTIGSSSHPTYHIQTLASTQDIVVVTMNYRVGPHGFLVSPDGVSAPGNAGLWDQVATLEWVQDHIRYFGGDPNQVTIGGVSAGAISASALFMSPVTRNLFNNVITMSGSSLIPTSFIDKKTEVLKTRHLASIVNCPTNDDQLMMECLIKIDGDKLILRDDEVIKNFPGIESFGIGLMTFAPVTGDELLPTKVSELINSEQLASLRKKTRVMTGLTNWEGGIMRYSNNRSVIVERVKNTFKDAIITQIDWSKGITNYLIDDYKVDESEAKLIVKLYFDEKKYGSDIKLRDAHGEQALFNLVGDLTFNCPTYFETELISQFVKSVSSYLFSFKSDNSGIFGAMCPDEGLVCHGMDIAYALGTALFKSQSYFYVDIDYEQAIQFTDLIGQFVRNEKLEIKRVVDSGNENIYWINYDPKDRTSIELNHLKNNPDIDNFREEYCNLLKKYILK